MAKLPLAKQMLEFCSLVLFLDFLFPWHLNSEDLGMGLALLLTASMTLGKSLIVTETNFLHLKIVGNNPFLVVVY